MCVGGGGWGGGGAGAGRKEGLGNFTSGFPQRYARYCGKHNCSLNIHVSKFVNDGIFMFLYISCIFRNRHRERERQRETETDRQTDRQRQRDTVRQRDRQVDRQTDRQTKF